MDKKSAKDVMQMLDFSETIDQPAEANSVRLYVHVLRKDKNNFLRRTLDPIVRRTRKAWLKAVAEQSRHVWMNESDTNNHSRWR